MYHIKLIVEEEKRTLLSFHYEYFRPAYILEDKYLKTLYKNYPYNSDDQYNLMPYYGAELPELSHNNFDKNLVREAFYQADSASTMLYGNNKVCRKQIYYDTLTQLRYDNRLDRTIIPNLNQLYDMETRLSENPSCRFSHKIVGGIFELVAESTFEDDFFYRWMFEGQMKNGEILVYRYDDDLPLRFSFWDCYCVQIGEQMTSYTSEPMRLKMRLSPAIIVNRRMEPFEKSWKKTELIREPFKAEPIAITSKMQNLLVTKKELPQVEPIVATPKPLALQITKVEGPREVLPKSTNEYFVASYNQENVSAINRARISWEVEVDGRKFTQEQHGEKLELEIIDEWIGKEIIIIPSLDNNFPNASLKVKVVKFKRSVYFASSMRKPGKVLYGDETAEDMKYGDITPEELLNRDDSFAKLLEADDRKLFANMYAMARVGSIISGRENAMAIIRNFEANTGKMYSSNYMNTCMKENKTLRQFVFDEEGILQHLCKELRNKQGNINQIPFLHKGEINSKSVKFISFKDLLNGMRISVDGTMAWKIYVNNYRLNSVNTFSCELHIHVYDHYGLDWEDILKFGNAHVGFNSWYVLQHVRGYKPFLTHLETIVPINNQKF